MGKQTISCLYCGEPYEFLSGVHFKREDHFGDRENAFEKYKEWVAEEYNLDLDHPVFEPGGLTKPSDFKEFEHLFGDG